MGRNKKSVGGTDNDMNVPLEKEMNDIIKYKVKVAGKNKSQKELIQSIKENMITICSGKAGTGKTFVSIAYALNLLQTKSLGYEKIYFVKSVTTLKGEEIGFLKGDINDKIDPFMWSFKINMNKIINHLETKALFENKYIETLPLAYARGVSLDNSIIIADEMQNVSLENARTLLTRIGENSKMILLGDTNQIDLRGQTKSSLEPLLDMFEGTEGFGCVRMDNNFTNIRNPIIDLIETKFEENGKIS